MQVNPIFMEKAVAQAMENVTAEHRSPYGNPWSVAAGAGFDEMFLYSEVKHPSSQCWIRTIKLLHAQAILNFEAWRKYAGRIDY
jgi:hypothetical protein